MCVCVCTEDSVALIGMGPIQRATLVALQQLAPPPPGVWPVMLETLCAMLCPHKLLPYRYKNVSCCGNTQICSRACIPPPR